MSSISALRAGETVKLLNNALLMVNRGSIADIVDLAVRLGPRPSGRDLVRVRRTGADTCRWAAFFATTPPKGNQNGESSAAGRSAARAVGVAPRPP